LEEDRVKNVSLQIDDLTMLLIQFFTTYCNVTKASPPAKPVSHRQAEGMPDGQSEAARDRSATFRDEIHK
jgi:hypothetical protein